MSKWAEVFCTYGSTFMHTNSFADSFNAEKLVKIPA